MIIFSLKVGKFDLVSMIILLSALETLLAEYLLTVNIRRGAVACLTVSRRELTKGKAANIFAVTKIRFTSIR